MVRQQRRPDTVSLSWRGQVRVPGLVRVRGQAGASERGGGMTSSFRPELGQAIFGVEYGAVRVSEEDYDYLTKQLLALSRKLVERGCTTSTGITGPRDGYGA